MAQIGNALTCRTEKGRVHHLGWFSNRFLLVGLVVQVALFLLLVYVEPLASLFEHLPIPPAYWLGLSLFAPALYALGWVGKSLARRADRRPPNGAWRGTTADHRVASGEWRVASGDLPYGKS
jgi:hypothetical protein